MAEAIRACLLDHPFQDVAARGATACACLNAAFLAKDLGRRDTRTKSRPHLRLPCTPGRI